MTNRCIATAPGSVFLCGEYAVLTGGDAVILAPPLRCRVTCEGTDGGDVVIRSDIGTVRSTGPTRSAVSWSGAKELEPLIDLVSRVQARVGTSSGLDIKVESEIPVGAGISSSSAVIAALAMATFGGLRGGGTDGLYDFLLPAQVAIHGGRASGVEILSSVFGGIHAICSQSHTRLAFGGLPKFIIADSGERRRTRDLLGSVRVSQELITSSTVNCKRIRLGIEECNWATVGRGMTEYHECLSALGVSTRKLDELVETALAAGADGAKMSGAGLGGVVVILSTPETHDEVTDALWDRGATSVWSVSPDSGCRIEA